MGIPLEVNLILLRLEFNNYNDIKLSQQLMRFCKCSLFSLIAFGLEKTPIKLRLFKNFQDSIYMTSDYKNIITIISINNIFRILIILVKN